VLLEENVATMDHRTLYVRAGDWVIGVAVLVLAMVCIWAALDRRARSGHPNREAAGRAGPVKTRRKGRARGA
jgi:hypothetical protein